MTCRELRDLLDDMTEEQLDCDATVWMSGEDEYFPADFALDHDSEGVLDPGHPVIVIDN